ncbi:MAG: hypothetical protein PHR06_03860 [Candidatus Cloacimonetes bacterium]|nr:hypothetical protein [Candidatus Cloacimonadota bacterium]
MEITTLSKNPQYLEHLLSINSTAWPEFMLNWKCSAWSHLYNTFSQFQILIIENDSLIAFGHTIPLYGEENLIEIPDNLKELIETAVDNSSDGKEPNLLLALAVVVSRNFHNKGLSYEILKEMKLLAKKYQLDSLIVPVRPTLKQKYPLTTIESYSKWTREDGLPFDSWLRVHHKLGGKVYKTSNNCITIEGTIQQWQQWSGLKIPESGYYIIDGALNPLEIDVEKNSGRYKDPCIWVKHHINSK